MIETSFATNATMVPVSTANELCFNVTSCGWHNSSTVSLLSGLDAIYYLKIFFVSTISIFIVISNVINIYILSKDSHIPKISRIFLLNLSVSDLCVGVISCVPTIYPAITEAWPYGPVWCQIAGILHGTSCGISIWSISMVSIDRYLAICKPLTYAAWRSSRKANTVIVILWILALGTFIAPSLSKPDFIYYHYNKDENMCGLFWEYKWFCIMTTAYFPLLSGSILVFTNARSIKTITSRKEDLSRTASRSSSKRHGMRAVKLLLITSSIYFLAWGPYVTEVLLISFAEGFYVPSLVKFSFMWLANSNSFMNVITFSVVYRSFRHELKRIFMKLMCCTVSCSCLCFKGDIRTYLRHDYVSSDTAYDSQSVRGAYDMKDVCEERNSDHSSNLRSDLSVL